MAEQEKPVTRTALAALFGVDVRTVDNWLTVGCPAVKRSGRTMYLLSEVIPWRRDQDRRETRSTPKIDEEQARKMRADADLSELKVQQMRGELLPVADVERDMERLCAMVRARVLAVRGRWAPKIIRLETMAEATSALDALAADVLDALRDGADDLEEPDAEEAA